MATGDGSTLEIRIPGLNIPMKFADWVHDRLFGTMELGNGDTVPLDAFASGPGQQIQGGGRGITHADSNLTRAGTNGLQSGYEAIIYSVQAEIKDVGYSAGVPALGDPRVEASVAQLHDLYTKGFCSFQYNGKNCAEGRLPVFPQGHGMCVVSNVTGQEVALNGNPSPRDQVALVMPIWLKPNIGFSFFFEPVVALLINQTFVYNGVTYTGGTAANYLDLQVTLEGLIKRPVR
jgi:hypothetical protein